LKAIINFEKSINDEKVRIAFHAELHEDRERKGEIVYRIKVYTIYPYKLR
jgi:hypothetical protein